MRLNKNVIIMAKEMGKLYPNDAGFVEAVNSALDFLESLPKTFEFRFNLQATPEKLGTEPPEVIENLARNVCAWQGYFIYSNAYKTHQILSAMVESLNSSKYVPAVTLARSLMEHAATIYDQGKQIFSKFKDISNEINQNKGGVSKRTIILMVETIRLCRKFGRLTRFNWRDYMKGDLESFYENWSRVEPEYLQTNVSTLIKKLPQEEKGAVFFYNMLSDFAHPNLGSQLLVIDETYKFVENEAMYILSREPESADSLGIVIHFIASPTKHSLDVITKWIKSLKEVHEQFSDLISGGVTEKKQDG